MGTTPALATPTQLSDQTQLFVPFISTGASWPRGSSVNLWPPVNNLFSNSFKGPPLSLDGAAMNGGVGGGELNGGV